MTRYLSIPVAVLCAVFCGPALAAPNILLIIADDMGVEALSAYGIGESAPTTAAIDEIAREGVLFRNFWSQPVCSPTRATIMTGRYGFRTGVGRPIAPAVSGGASGPLPDPPAKPASAPWEPVAGVRDSGNPVSRGLPSTEFMLPMALGATLDGTRNKAYQTAAIGKWHLADVDNGWLDHPRRSGIDFSSVIMHGENSYFAWRKVLNGEVVGSTVHSAVDQTNTAIKWISEQGDDPWFMWLSYILPHTPLHLPPEELLQSDYSDLSTTQDTSENPIRYFHAMIEAMDTEIGRVLNSIAPEVRENTYVIFIGDNGTGNNSVIAPFAARRAKGTVYQGGVNVPLIVSGPQVTRGGVSQALVNSTDLFATILEMAELNREQVVPREVILDSTSLVPYLSNPAMPSIRDWVYADVFPGSFAGVENANYAMRNQRYKLLRNRGIEEFYDLNDDPYEHVNLLEATLSSEQQTNYDSLRSGIDALRSSL